MKQITFWVQPFAQQELTTYVNEEDWAKYESMVEHGEPADTIFQDLFQSHNFNFGQMTILPSYSALSLEWSDCDCKDAKKSTEE